MQQIFIPILKSLPKLSDQSHEKCVLIDLLLHRLLSYHKKKDMKAVVHSFLLAF